MGNIATTTIHVDDDYIAAIFEIAHCDTGRQTTLTQELELIKTKEGWRATVDFSDAKYQKTPTDSATLLADMFERIAEEIKKHNFDKIDLFEDYR